VVDLIQTNEIAQIEEHAEEQCMEQEALAKTLTNNGETSFSQNVLETCMV
jgi:hypothetical protein